MTTQLLFYQSATPVSKSRHGSHSLEVVGNYGFARSVNSMPLTAVEFLQAAQHYPLVFAGAGDEVMPAVILGLRDQHNAFVDAAGNWADHYIPAFARRYPFVFATADSGQNFTLCIDETFPGLNTEGRGERLFDAEGNPTEYVNNVLKFLQQYQVEFQRTQQFCKLLKELDVFEPMQADITLADGARLSLTGFMSVSRAKLKEASVDALAGLVKNDGMELIYAHLHSMRHFAALRERTVAAAPASGDTAASAGAPAAEASPAEATPAGAGPADEPRRSGRRRGGN